MPTTKKKKKATKKDVYSIVQFDKSCIVCGKTRDLDLHHVMNGVGLREKSTKYGLVCWVCREHHTAGKYSIHNNQKLDEKIKRFTQAQFETIFDRRTWMKEFHKNYLWKEDNENDLEDKQVQREENND